MTSSSDWFANAAKELDQMAAQMVKSMARKAVAPVSHTDEAQLINLSQSLNAIAATARNSVVWRCGVAAVCGENPASLDSSSGGGGVSNGGGGGGKDTIGSSSSFQMTNLDSRISVISRITDILSLIFVAHDYFVGSDHEAVLKSNTVSMLAVVAGACDVPFLPQPLCSSALEALAACLTDVTAVVHAEQSVLSDGAGGNSNKEPPRRFPLVFSLSAQRYLLKSLSRRIFTPQYSSWLISALGAPDRLTPYPGASSSMNMSSNNSNAAAAMMASGENQQQQQQHSCFLKDAILRICCGGFMGDGPKASPHSYVATSLHVLSMLLLTPIEMPEQQQLCFDRRAPQIFGGSSVEGIATILEALTRRVAAPFQQIAQQHQRASVAGTQYQQHQQQQQQPSTEKVIRQNKRLLKFFWSVRPLVDSLASSSLTRKAFIAAQSTRSLFDFVWKTVAGLLDTITAEREAARGTATFHTTADGSAVSAAAVAAANNNHCTPAIAAAVLSACTVLLPIGCSIWRAVSAAQGGGENREFVETVALFASKAAPLLVPAPATRFVVDGGGQDPSSSSFATPFYSSYDSLLAFDALVDAVEYAAGIEGGGGGGANSNNMMEMPQSVHSSLREFLSHASPQGTLVAIRSAPDSADEQASIIQSQWAALLVTLGMDDQVSRCRLASMVEPPRAHQHQQQHNFHQSAVSFLVTSDGMNSSTSSSSSNAPPMHLIEFMAGGGSGGGGGNSTTTVVVDTALRDAVRANDDPSSSSSLASTPDMVLGCLCASAGSPLAEDLPRWMPCSVLRRALLRLACRATGNNNNNNNISLAQQQQLSARDICRVFARPPNFAAAQLNTNSSSMGRQLQQQLVTGNGISLSWPPVMRVVNPAARSAAVGFEEQDRRGTGTTTTAAGGAFSGVAMRSYSTTVLNKDNATSYQRQQQNSSSMGSAMTDFSVPRGVGGGAAASGFMMPSNNASSTPFMMKQPSSSFIPTKSFATPASVVAESEATANALRLELAEQKAVNFELQREVQKRSGEAGSMEARLRQLTEQLSNAEMEMQQHRVSAETSRQLLEQDRQHKSQLFHSESQLRAELSAAQSKLREMEHSRFDAVQQAETRANQLASQLAAAQVELEMTRRNLAASEERVNRFKALQSSMRDLMQGGGGGGLGASPGPSGMGGGGMGAFSPYTGGNL